MIWFRRVQPFSSSWAVVYEEIVIFDQHIALSRKRYKYGLSYNGRRICDVSNGIISFDVE